MDQELLSKKELLELTGISYGQLYRWKRKNLIPEEWFIRKSTFTGQETFFPKDKIILRINKIKNMKEDLSLDDLAEVLSPGLTEIVLNKDELVERNIVSGVVMDFYREWRGETINFTFEKVIQIYLLDAAFLSGVISLEEGKMLLQAMEEYYPKVKGKNCELVFLRKFGFSTCFLISPPGEYYFENGAKVVARFNLETCIEELKLKLSKT